MEERIRKKEKKEEGIRKKEFRNKTEQNQEQRGNRHRKHQNTKPIYGISNQKFCF